MKRKLLSLTAASILAAAGSSHAATINVNFGLAKTESTLVGPGGGSGETWNQAGTSTSASALKDAENTTTGIGWALSAGSVTAGNWNNALNLTMLESAFYHSNNARTLTLSGLDITKTYNLYIASYDQNSWGIGAMTFSTTNTTTTVGAQVAANTGGGTAWALNDNYVLFEGLVPDGSNNITISGAETGGGTYGFWNGFQLVAVPEPSAALLGGLGMLVLLRRRRA